MSWIWLLLLSIAIGSFASVLQKSHVGKSKNNGATSGALINIAQAVILLIIGVVSGTLQIHFEMPMGWYAILAILIFMLGGYAYYSALYSTDISVITIVLTFRAVVSALLASTFLHERVTIIQFGGFLIIGIAIFIVQFATAKKKSHFKSSGFLYIVIATFLFGIGNVLERHFLTTNAINQMFYLILVFGCTGIGQLLMSFMHRKRVVVHINTASVRRLILIGIFGAISAVFSIKSFVMAPSASVFVFASQSRVIITILMAYILLRERTHARIKIVGSILCMIGLILLH